MKKTTKQVKTAQTNVNDLSQNPLVAEMVALVNEGRKPVTKSQLSALNAGRAKRNESLQVGKMVRLITEALVTRRNYKLTLAEQTDSNTSVETDTNKLLGTINKYAPVFFEGFKKIALATNREPAQVCYEFCEKLSICKKCDEYIAQKIFNKLPEVLYAIAKDRGVSDTLILGSVIALNLVDYRDHHGMIESYHGATTHNQADQERVRKDLKGGFRYTVDTASTQACQCKSLFRALGLISFIKGEKDTPIEIKPGAEKLFLSMKNNEKIYFKKRDNLFIE